MHLIRKTTLFLATMGFALASMACQSPTSDGNDKKTSALIGVLLGTAPGTTVAPGGVVAANNAVVGTPSTTVFTVRNTGDAALTLKAPVLSGTDAALFTVTAPPALTVAAGASTAFTLTFTPVTAGPGKTATVTIANNSSNKATFAFTVTADATAVPAPALGISVASSSLAPGGTIDFGSLALGTSGTVSLTLSNVGTAPMTGLAASLTGSAEYTVTTAPADTVAVGGSTTAVLTLTPVKTTGIRTGGLTLANSAGEFTALLSGAGTVASKVYSLTQSATPATSTASFANKTIALYNSFTKSNNNFKFAPPNFYGSSAHSFVTFPVPMTGDFSIRATITSTFASGGSATSGIGLGMTTGFTPTDKYAYTLLTNTGAINLAYVSSATTVTGVATTGTPNSFTSGTPVNITFQRVGTTLSFGATGSTLTPLDANLCTDGSTVVGTAPVYPCLALARATATVTNLVIVDGTGTVVYDSEFGGSLGTYMPAALTVGASTVNVGVGASLEVTAVANADGYDAPGAIGTVTAAVVAGSGSVTASVANGPTGSVVTLTGVTAGTATVNLTSDPATGSKTKSIAVTVTGYPVNDAAYTLTPTSFYPVPGTTDAYTDGELAITFDTVPTLETGGLVKIFQKSDGAEVDSITFVGEAQSIPTSAATSLSLNVGTQLVRVDAATKTVYITPHFGKLRYGTAYYVAFPSTSVAGTFGGAAFEGLSSDKAVATWNFTTRVAPTLDASNITVSNDPTNSSSDFRSVGGALMSLVKEPLGANTITINVAAGTYTELVQYRPSTANLSQTVTIRGPANTRGDTCVIQYVNGTGINAGAQNLRASFYFAGANLVLQNLTIKNNGVRATVTQAEALYFDSKVGSTLAVGNCSIISRQDTVNTTGRAWFFRCYLEGNVDFLWGTSDAALFEDCALKVVNDDAANNKASSPYALIVSRTAGLLDNLTYTSDSANSGTANMAAFTGTVGKGYVLKDSTVTIGSPSTGTGNTFVTLARDAGAGKFYDQVAVVNTTFSSDAANLGVLDSDTASKNYLWSYGVQTKLGDSTFVGFKAVGNSGLNLGSLTTDIAAYAASSINSQATEYDTRDHILNRVVTVSAGAPVGYQASPLGVWDVSALASAFGAP